MSTKNAKVMVTISHDGEIIYRKQHTISADYQHSEVGPIYIKLNEPICYVKDLRTFGDKYFIEISTPEKADSKLWSY
jgi:hypothetical protein